MPQYKLTAINIGSFNLGEADRILTLFSAERGVVRAVAKSARKPGKAMTGRSELLNINQLLLATGRSLDIITQAQTLETFSSLRQDLSRLSYALYYAELTCIFGTGLTDESASYFDFLQDAIQRQSKFESKPEWLCLRFELGLLDMLGYKPELTLCMNCQNAIDDYSVARFDHELDGVLCSNCKDTQTIVAEHSSRSFTELTPLVWKQLVLASQPYPNSTVTNVAANRAESVSTAQSLFAAHRLMQNHLEYKAGKQIRSLDLLKSLQPSA
jgi:DNA repair protein RecO (recombination protein O)